MDAVGQRVIACEPNRMVDGTIAVAMKRKREHKDLTPSEGPLLSVEINHVYQTSSMSISSAVRMRLTASSVSFSPCGSSCSIILGCPSVKVPS